MKEYKNYKEVPVKYKWDLSFLLEGKTPEQALNNLIKSYKKFIPLKESKYDSKSNFLSYLKLSDKFSVQLNKFSNYISNGSNRDVTDTVFKTLGQKYQIEMLKITEQIGSEENRFFKHKAKLAKWAKLSEFKEYKHSIEKTLEEKKYVLSKNIEEYIIKTSKGSPDYTEIFSILTDSEMDYGYAKNSNNKKVKITRANKMKLAESNDKSLRKTSAVNFKKAYIKNKDSLTSLLYQHKKTESANILSRGFKSSIDGLIFSDRVNKDFLNVLYKAVQDNKAIFKPYYNAHKRYYKKKFGEAITKYDWARPLLKTKQEYTVAESIKLYLNSIKPFGKEYEEVSKKAFKENWVDFMTVKNKTSGAYSIGSTFGVDKKLILMNFTGDLRSVETLAHEMGHSMHSYFSDTRQKTPGNSSYPIFLAEIASIFNELMLNDHLQKTLKDKKTRWYLLDNKIKGFIGTVNRQVEWSNFEYDLYEKIDQGVPIGSYDVISKIYYDNATKYSVKKPKKFKAEDNFYSIYVPHFYYGFYVYKYAIGQLVANIFFAKYKKEGTDALKFYVDKFLSAGGKENPLEILKEAGIDLNNPKTYDIGFNDIKQTIKEYTKLGKEIFKV